MNNSLYEIFDNRGIRIAVMGVLAILALYLCAQTLATAGTLGRSGIAATDTIVVDGAGQATLAPDVAHISFTVENTSAAVADAQAATTKQTNAALDYIKGQGIADKDVKTQSYSINPQYAYPTPCPQNGICTYTSPKVTGYTVSQSILVKVRDLKSVGTLLAGIGKLGVQNLSGPDFALDDATAGYNAARADAIAKAKAQATLLASQLGVKLGKIVSFSESNGGGYYPVAYSKAGGAMDAAAPTPQVPVGENTYNASVSITYEIR